MFVAVSQCIWTMFAFESGGAFSDVQRVHTSSKRNPLQELA